MVYQYKSTLQDFKDAQRTFAKVVRNGRQRRVFWNQVLPALGLFAAVLLVVELVTPVFKFSPFMVDILCGLAWFGLFTLIVRPMTLRRAYKQFKNGRPDSEPLELEIEGDELISRIPGVAEVRYRRAAFLGATEDEKMMVLFTGRSRFLYLPKREVSPECLHALRIWLLNIGETTNC